MTNGSPTFTTWEDIRIEVRHRLHTDPIMKFTGMVLHRAKLFNETWIATTPDREAVEKRGRQETTVDPRVAGEAAVYQRIAATDPQPAVPAKIIGRAKALGIALREPAPRLENWVLRTLSGTPQDASDVSNDSMLMLTYLDPTTAQTVGLAARAAKMETNIFVPDERYAGLSWYDPLVRLDRVEVEITDWGKIFTDDSDEAIDSEGSRVVERIDVILHGTANGFEGEKERILLTLDGVLAFGRTRKAVHAGGEPVVYGARNLRVDADELATTMGLGLGASQTEPDRRIEDKLRFIATKLRHGTERAAREAIVRATRTDVVPWTKKLLEPSKRRVEIVLTGGQVEHINVSGKEIEEAERPAISPTAHIHPGATLEGDVKIEDEAVIECDVYLGKGCNVGAKAQVRHDARVTGINRIGEGAVIEENTRIELIDGVLTVPIECRSADGTAHDISNGEIPPGTQVREPRRSVRETHDMMRIVVENDGTLVMKRRNQASIAPVHLRLNDQNVVVETEADMHVVFDSPEHGSVTLLGGGAGHVRRSGNGNGAAKRLGNGDGNAWRGGRGKGDAIREGNGWGNAGRGNDGNGDAVRSGTGLGNAWRKGSGDGDAHRSGRGCGDAVREGNGSGEATHPGYGSGEAISQPGGEETDATETDPSVS